MKPTKSDLLKILIDALKNIPDKPIYFGELSNNKFIEVNQIREKYNQPLIVNPSILIYPNVLKKILSKRIEKDKLLPNKIARIALGAVHNEKSIVLPSKYPHIQSIIEIGETISNIVYIGKYKNIASLKSIYQKRNTRIKNTLGGPTVPPSALGPAGSGTF